MTSSTLLLVESLHRAVLAVRSYGPLHPVAERAIGALEQTVAASTLPLRLQFVGGCVYVDRQLLTLDFARFTRIERLVSAAINLGAHEIEFSQRPPRSELAMLLGALALGMSGPSDALDDVVAGAISWRSIDTAAIGDDGEEVDVDVAAIMHVALALNAADRIADAGEAWPWPQGLIVVRQLERALALDAGATIRSLELSGPWNAARAGVSAARSCLQALAALGIAVTLRRAAVHACLGICMTARRDDVGLNEAAASFVSRGAENVKQRETVSVHALRTLAAARSVSGRTDSPAALTGLVNTVVGLELARGTGPVSASRVELLAWGLKALDQRWMPVVIQCEGAVPPGCPVRLADGRVGTVVGATDPAAPWRPLVLVEGAMIKPRRDVEIVAG